MQHVSFKYNNEQIPIQIPNQQYEDSIIQYYLKKITLLVNLNEEYIKKFTYLHSIKKIDSVDINSITANASKITNIVKETYNKFLRQATVNVELYDSIQRDIQCYKDDKLENRYEKILEKLRPIRDDIQKIKKKKYCDMYVVHTMLFQTNYIIANYEIQDMYNKYNSIITGPYTDLSLQKFDCDNIKFDTYIDLVSKFEQFQAIYTNNVNKTNYIRDNLKNLNSLKYNADTLLEKSHSDLKFVLLNIENDLKLNFIWDNRDTYEQLCLIHKSYSFLTKEEFLKHTRLPNVLIDIIINY